MPNPRLNSVLVHSTHAPVPPITGGIDIGAGGSFVVGDSGGVPFDGLRFDSVTPLEVYNFLLQIKTAHPTLRIWVEKLSPSRTPEGNEREGSPAGPGEEKKGRFGRGSVANFKLGRAYGQMVDGFLVAARIPFEEVRAQDWQKALGCPSKGDKRITRARAQALWPDVHVTHTFADGLLIYEYGRRKLASRQPGSADPPTPRIELAALDFGARRSRRI